MNEVKNQVSDRRHIQVTHWKNIVNRTILVLSCTLVVFFIAFSPLVSPAQTQLAPETMTQTLKIHAGYALRLGVTQNELKEIIYLTTVTAGFPHSIDAAQALQEVLAASLQKPSTAH